ncbi:origin recognition complex subunit 3 N-terminus-domain-containing protein [Zopfochytrium polystomum]|nr:origin recognition complex subunit 3 N-terminus-domain-containing protein [Zopfochytrium polystomum]
MVAADPGPPPSFTSAHQPPVRRPFAAVKPFVEIDVLFRTDCFPPVLQPTCEANPEFTKFSDASDDSRFGALRMTLFEQEWRAISEIIEACIARENEAAVLSISNFVESISFEPDGHAKRTLVDVPAALVLGGMNSADNSQVFKTLLNHLRSTTETFVAQLNPLVCNDIASMIKAMVRQLTSQGEPDAAAGTDESETEAVNEKRLPKRAGDMKYLRQWFDGVSTTSARLVVLLHDFEQIPSSVFDDFVRICSANRSHVPLVLLLGLSTSFELFHQAVSRRTLSLLQCRKFSLSTSSQCVEAIINELLLTRKLGVKLSHSTFHLLFDEGFQKSHRSLAPLIAGFEYATLAHFYRNPLSIFATFGSSENDLREIRSILDEFPIMFEWLRSSPSFRQHIDNLILSGHLTAAKDLLTEDDALMDLLFSSIHDCQHQSAVNNGIFRITQATLAFFKRPPLAASRMYTCAVRHENLTTYGFMDDISKQIRTGRNPRKLLRLLLVWVELLKEIAVDDTAGVLTDLGKLVSRVQESLEKDQFSESESDEDQLMFRNQSQASPVLRVRKERTTRVAQLLKPITLTGLDGWSFEAEQIFRRLLDTKFRQLHKLPFCEIYQFGDWKHLKRSFMPQPRAVVKIALQSPKLYLGCSRCGADPRTSDCESEDISLVYCLHLECGHLINLYDLLTSFSLIVKSRSPNTPDVEIQARFVKAVAELEFLGFVKQTSRKTDHLQRLTWSSIL